MPGRLSGLSTIITGGAGGIGSACARLFCEEGASVLLVDRDADACRAAASDISDHVVEAKLSYLALDLAEEKSATEVVASALEKFGRLDCVVNNAGIRSYEPLSAAQSKTWHDILAINLLSYAYLCREALPELRRSGTGSIVNVSSTHGLNPRAGMGQYDVTKAGIISMTKTLAAEEAGNGVRVNAICPGPTLTSFHIKRAATHGQSAENLKAEKRRDCLMGRWADPREVAYPILWLASTEASFVTATAIMVDGGMPVI